MTPSAYKCLESTTNRIYVSHHVQFIPHIFPFATRHVLHVPRQSDVSLPIMSCQPDVLLPTMPDDVIGTPVPLDNPPQQDVSPDLQQQHVSHDLHSKMSLLTFHNIILCYIEFTGRIQGTLVPHLLMLLLE
ncbi:hypothetical protein V6N11_081900 [Hibiscus sabdariffa]|uniref:Uncharacterized protein n=1 Tax=Hibiscus sabdariffa TaxID=183260 RepID=A0ABR2Q7X0_9ROSI